MYALHNMRKIATVCSEVCFRVLAQFYHKLGECTRNIDVTKAVLRQMVQAELGQRMRA